MDLLSERINREEGLTLEFKEKLPEDRTKWLKTVVAFANGSGGTLMVGIDNSRRLVGVSEDSADRMCDEIIDNICQHCEPQISASASVQRIGYIPIIVVEVYPGVNRPYFVKEIGKEKGIFIRIGATSRQADEFMTQELAIQGKRTSFDRLINYETKVTDSDIERICSELSSLGSRDISKRDLENAGAIIQSPDGPRPSNAYALLKHDSPFIFTTIRCAVFKGIDGVEFIDQAEFSCPLHEQVEGSYRFILRNIRLSGKVEGLVRKDKYELPPNSIRELILNAVQHRSYVDHTKQIFIAIYDDRLEITSPGGLPPSINVELMRSGRTAHRNPVISEVFRRSGFCEGWGNGIKTVLEECQLYGLPEPTIEDSGIDVRVTLYRQPIGGNGGIAGGNGGKKIEGETDIEKAIMDTMVREPEITLRQVSDSLGIPLRSVERNVSRLKGKGLVKRIGSTRSGTWSVNSRER